MKVCEDFSNPAVCDAGETVVVPCTYDAGEQRVKSAMGTGRLSGSTCVAPFTSGRPGQRLPHHERNKVFELRDSVIADLKIIVSSVWPVPAPFPAQPKPDRSSL
jgi:hypothetical protein